jgi:hypothetical protein
MSELDDNWRKEILQRFEGRQALGRDELYDRYFAHIGLPKSDVFKCLDLIEFEYEIPSGILRPDDKLERLIKPVATHNPWRWLVYRTHEGDSESELNYQLGNRMRKYGTVGSWSHVRQFGDLTFAELLRAWCGLTK